MHFGKLELGHPNASQLALQPHKLTKLLLVLWRPKFDCACLMNVLSDGVDYGCLEQLFLFFLYSREHGLIRILYFFDLLFGEYFFSFLVQFLFDAIFHTRGSLFNSLARNLRGSCGCRRGRLHNIPVMELLLFLCKNQNALHEQTVFYNRF